MRKHASLLIVAVAATVVAGIARATSPGANGQIAFAAYLDGTRTTRAIDVINVDGSGERQITHPAMGHADGNPDWSPDGSKIAFERNEDGQGGRSQIWTVNRDGTGLRRVGPRCAGNPPSCADWSTPSWSPDGKRIAFWRQWGPVNNELNAIKYTAIYVMNADGGDVHQVSRSKPFADYGKGAVWSPDGKQLVFERLLGANRKPANGRALFVVSSDGTRVHQLTPWRLRAGEPDWSPDGKLILFRSISASDDENHGNLYTIHPDGTGVRQLTHDPLRGYLLSSSFSPDGRWITFAKTGVGGQPDIFVMRADGTDVHPVTRTPLWESQPDWGATP